MASARSLLDQSVALVDAVEGLDVASAPDAVLVAALRRVGDTRRQLDALGAELAAQVAIRSSGEESLAVRFGEKSAAALVSRLVGIEPDESRDWCAAGSIGTPEVTLVGELLPLRHPVTAEALDTGALGVRSARLIVETLDEVATHTAPVEMAGLVDVERVLVDLAPTLSLRELRRLCTQVIDRANPDGVEPREDELRRKSGVRVIQRSDGLVQWIVTMHPEAAGFLTAAVDARTAPRRTPTFQSADDAPEVDGPARRDDRTLDQRRLDALVSIARDSLAHDDGEVAGTAVTMVVNVDYETLVSGVGAATIEGIDFPISAATARRLAADAEIIPVLLRAESEDLDIGRSGRLFNRAQRRAIAFRDGGCTWPGCTAPPGWCEIAHIVAWILGGPTDLTNGLMLCPFHHRRFDNDGWSFEWRDGVPWFIPPPWLDATLTPRRGGRPRVAA